MEINFWTNAKCWQKVPLREHVVLNFGQKALKVL